MKTYLVKVFEDWCELPAWGAPVGREVEADDVLASQGIVGGDWGQLSPLLESFSLNYVHVELICEWSESRQAQLEYENVNSIANVRVPYE